MDVELFAPYDSELNPEGEVKKEKVPPETSLQAKKGRCQTNRVPGRISLQGTSPEKNTPRRRRTRWDASPKPYYKPPGHWREMTQVGGRQNGSLEEKLWREIVQKVLYADAVCGTSTPIEALDLLLHY